MARKTFFTAEGAVVAAATQLDISAASGGETFAGLVQPGMPRRLVLDTTDANTSISAFQIDIVGTDYLGAAQTESLVFADGIDQTSTKYWKTITSVTLTSITGNGAGDLMDLDWEGNGQSTAFLNQVVEKAGFFVHGTWDTATVTLQISPDGGTTWLTHDSGTTLTADGWVLVELPAGASVRAALSSVGSSTSLTALLV